MLVTKHEHAYTFTRGSNKDTTLTRPDRATLVCLVGKQLEVCECASVAPGSQKPTLPHTIHSTWSY